MLECSNCPYHYREFDWETQEYVEDHPCCHFEKMFNCDLAPCEYMKKTLMSMTSEVERRKGCGLGSHVG